MGDKAFREKCYAASRSCSRAVARSSSSRTTRGTSAASAHAGSTSTRVRSCSTAPSTRYSIAYTADTDRSVPDGHRARLTATVARKALRCSRPSPAPRCAAIRTTPPGAAPRRSGRPASGRRHVMSSLRRRHPSRHPRSDPHPRARVPHRRHGRRRRRRGQCRHPGVGWGVSLALSGVETAGFLEASALFAQSVTEVHGIAVSDPDRARALVMAMMLGAAGTDCPSARRRGHGQGRADGFLG